MDLRILKSAVVLIFVPLYHVFCLFVCRLSRSFFHWLSTIWLWCVLVWFPILFFCLGFIELLGSMGIQPRFSTRGHLFAIHPLQGYLAVSGAIFGHHKWVVLLAPSEQIPELLLNILQYTEQPPQQSITQPSQ